MRFLITCAVVLGYAANASAETWTVDDDGPADFDTIQGAIIMANAGDTVLVEPGTYNRIWANNFVVDLLGKPITIRATGSPDVTILDEIRRGGLCTQLAQHGDEGGVARIQIGMIQQDDHVAQTPLGE